jgi:hypothetical protein
MKASDVINLVEPKLDNKEQLLARVQYSIELILIQHCMLEVGYL